MTRLVRMAERMVAELAGKVPAGWVAAVGAVERALFIPARMWVYDERNAALLAARLGDDGVTTIEIDTTVAE